VGKSTVNTSSVTAVAKTPSEKPMIRLATCLLTLPAACGATFGGRSSLMGLRILAAYRRAYLPKALQGVLRLGLDGTLPS
jgi:hypothetical protein